MRHLICIAALLALFFWSGPGWPRYVSAHSVLVVASDGNGNVSKEETQAKAMAKRRYDNFMKTYNKIWSLFGSIHYDFDGTASNHKFTMLTSNWQNYITHRRRLENLLKKLSSKAWQGPKTSGESSESHRTNTLNPAAYDLGREITGCQKDLNELKQKARKVTIHAEAAKHAMEQACAARDRATADSMAQRSKQAATAAIENYKVLRNRWPDIKKTRDKYRNLSKDLVSMENFAKEYQVTYQNAEKVKAPVFKELGDKDGVYNYLRNQRIRLSQLKQTLNTHDMEFNVITRSYEDKRWVKNFLFDMQEARKRVNTISTRLDEYILIIYDSSILPQTEDYDEFLGIKKNLDTFFSTVDEIQTVGQEANGAAKAALNNAKKAKACADKLPTVPPHSKKDHECPSSWNRCGNYCCPPDVPCWDYGAIKRAVRAGRCR